MDLKTYLKSLGDDEARERFALACETTLGHMKNTIYVESKFLSPATCVLVEQHSGGALRRWAMRPQDWHRIWPELIGTAGAPRVDVESASSFTKPTADHPTSSTRQDKQERRDRRFDDAAKGRGGRNG